MTLYPHSLLFCCPNELIAFDCIPTYQILDVKRYPALNSMAGECIAITYIPSRSPPGSQREHDNVRLAARDEYETKTIHCRTQKADEWIKALDSVGGVYHAPSCMARLQSAAQTVEQAPIFQMLMASAILVNFILLCYEAQVCMQNACVFVCMYVCMHACQLGIGH